MSDHRISHEGRLRGWDAMTRESIAGMSRDECIFWLEWNDRNGSFRDEDAIADGFEPLTLEGARELLTQVRFGEESR